jgi:hypothetical protein
MLHFSGSCPHHCFIIPCGSVQNAMIMHESHYPIQGSIENPSHSECTKSYLFSTYCSGNSGPLGSLLNMLLLHNFMKFVILVFQLFCFDMSPVSSELLVYFTNLQFSKSRHSFPLWCVSLLHARWNILLEAFVVLLVCCSIQTTSFIFYHISEYFHRAESFLISEWLLLSPFPHILWRLKFNYWFRSALH